MRVKTVPRQLARKVAASSSQSSAAGSKGAVSRQDGEVELPLKSANFSSAVGDIVEQLDGGGTAKQDRRRLEAALDLSAKGAQVAREAADSSSDKFKDTYLYQLMTDPQFLQRASRESRLQLAGTATGSSGSSGSRRSCPYCKREFGSESQLKAHLSFAAADEATSRQLSCCACGKSFAQKRYLRYHQRSHSERSKYSCDICTRKYSRLDNLTRHNIFHTNPDKFPCSSCERTFARKDLLNKHLKCHENKYKYHCDICQKYFKGPLSLDNHTKLFHAPAQRPFQLSSAVASSFTSQSC